MTEHNCFVYILECSDGSFYTGITDSISRRLDEHNLDDNKAARWTKRRRPVELAFFRYGFTRRGAAKAERWIKGMTRKRKERLINLDQSLINILNTYKNYGIS